MRALILVLILSVCPSCLYAQDFGQGIKPYHSYDQTSIDAVDNYSHNLDLHIPLVSYPQRGKVPVVTVSLGYTNRFWYYQCYDNSTVQGSIYCNWYPTSNAPGVSFRTSPYFVVEDVPNFDFGRTDAYFIVDASATRHPLGWTGPNTFASIDATGMKVGSDGDIYTSDGTRYRNNSGVIVEDTNGNSISGAIYGYSAGDMLASGDTWVDTVGRAIPIVGGPASGYAQQSGCRTVSFPGVTNGAYPISLCTSPVNIRTNFCQDLYQGNCYANLREYVGTEYLLSSVTLPNGSSWTFGYNSYGDLSTINTPTGGKIFYEWGMQSGNSCMGGVTPRFALSRTLDSGNGSPQQKWTYSAASSIDPDGNATQYTFGLPDCICGGYPVVEKHYTGSGSNAVLVKTIETTYNPGYHYSAFDYVTGSSDVVNVAPASIKTSFANGATSQETSEYDTGATYYDGNPNGGNTRWPFIYGLKTATATYDFGAGTPGPMLQSTHTAYKWQEDGNYLDANLLGLPCLTTVYGPGSVPQSVGCTPPPTTANQVAQTASRYDENNGSPQGVHGNQTSQSSWLNTGGQITSSAVYNSQGMPSVKTDANGNPTYIVYNQCNGAFPSQITNALQQSTNYVYDCAFGQVTSVRNPNDVANGSPGTTITYNNMGDTQSVSYSDGGVVSADYHGYQLPLVVTTTKAAAPDPPIVTSTMYDGFGRQTAATLPDGATSETTYDGEGRVASKTDPHVAMANTSGVTTTFLYDGIGRLRMTMFPDSAYKQISYTGNVVSETDETQNQWQRTVNPLGRLTRVVEPGSLTTDYTYDVLGNLLCIDQWGTSTPGSSCGSSKKRIFTYDSLSRLLTSTNPEIGVICYGERMLSFGGGGGRCANGYDGNGNLLRKTDFRGVTTSYTYDVLNRLTRKSYSDGTHTVGFGYDGFGDDGVTPVSLTSNAIGRLTHISNDVDAATSLGYDAMGRPSSEILCLPSACDYSKTVRATYNLAGNMRDLIYPDGRTVRQSFDAAGRLSGIGDGTNSQAYLQSVLYHPDGKPHVTTLGNAVQQQVEENSRLQVLSMQAYDPLQQKTYMSRTYCYVNCPTGGTANNGNIWGIDDRLDSSRSLGFTYDALNRISSFSRGGVVNQQYQIDSFGNMSGLVNGQPAFSFDPATNRIANLPCAASVTPYDDAGNQQCTMDRNGGVQTIAYDGESRIAAISALGSATPFEKYTYGADGSRVRKSGADGNFTEYVYWNGQPLAEKDQTGAWTDYVYANGQKIARIEPSDVRAHLSGVRPSSGPWGVYVLGSQYSYQIKSGDLIAFRMYQHNAVAGISLGYSDGSNSDNYCTADAQGVCIGVQNQSDVWVNRVADLSYAAGKTLQYIFIEDRDWGPPGSYDVMVADMVILSADGTITPFLGRDKLESISGDGNTYRCGAVGANWHTDCRTERVTGNALGGGSTTTYVLADHLGTASLELTPGGWPVWRAEFAPFGQELSSTSTGTSNRYKFTGKERDSESGLDYFGARYYGSSMGRFMSPDWDSKPQAIPYANLADPQSLNLYSYVLNNPLSKADPNGHDWFDIEGKWLWQKGHVYHDEDGNPTKAKGYAGLLVAEKTGTNKQGATTFKLTLYDQNKVAATGTGFSGNSSMPGMEAIKVGNYQILGRFDAPPTGPNPASADNNPSPVYGYQKIDPSLNSYANAVYQAYGPMRARLNSLDGNPAGVYFHGQFGDAFHSEGWTHGCLSYGRDTTIINYMADHFGSSWTGVSIGTPVVKP